MTLLSPSEPTGARAILLVPLLSPLLLWACASLRFPGGEDGTGGGGLGTGGVAAEPAALTRPHRWRDGHRRRCPHLSPALRRERYPIAPAATTSTETSLRRSGTGSRLQGVAPLARVVGAGERLNAGDTC